MQRLQSGNRRGEQANLDFCCSLLFRFRCFVQISREISSKLVNDTADLCNVNYGLDAVRIAGWTSFNEVYAASARWPPEFHRVAIRVHKASMVALGERPVYTKLVKAKLCSL